MRQLALLTLLAGGCSWVSSDDVECQKLLADDDGDGYPLHEKEPDYEGADWCSHLTVVDCDDADAEIHPEAQETWYDGIDQDCAADDDFDQDIDGYVADEYQGQATDGVEGTGALPGGDCDDLSAEINPQAADEWYDGADSDCSGNDDYDQDGDGYVLDEYSGLATTYVDGSGALPAGDCDDSLANVSPGATDDWYDGTDSDCSGNDDYDQDADLHVQDEHSGLTTTYVEKSGGLAAGDCDDLDPSIYEAALDDWYDGTDSDCALDDDYDQDLDGFVQDQHFGAVTAGVKGSGLLPAGDCDDRDDTIFPGAVELLGDDVDQDCDYGGVTGGEDSFTLTALPDLAWIGPQGLGFADDDGTLYLGVNGEEIDDAGTVYYDSAVALAFDPDQPELGITDVLPWLRNLADPSDNLLTPGMDLVVGGGTLFGTVGIAASGTRQQVLRGYDLDTANQYGANPPVSEGLSFDDAAVALDTNGDVHAVGCTVSDSENAFAYIWAAPDTLSGNSYDDTSTEAISARACTLDFFDTLGDGTVFMGRMITEDVAQLVIYGFQPQGSGGGEVIFVERRALLEYDPVALQVFDAAPDRWLMLADGGASTLYLLSADSSFAVEELYSAAFLKDPLLTASATVAPDGTVYMAAVTEGGAVSMAYGVPDFSKSWVQVEFLTDVLAEDVAIWAGDTHVVLAVSGYDPIAGEDVVVYGYAQLGP